MQFQPNTCLPAPSDETIRAMEENYEIKLPNLFVQFLQSGNGGTPIQNEFRQGTRERVIEFFLCLLDAPADNETRGWGDINVVITQLDERLVEDEDAYGIPIIPFGALFGGDFICLDYRENPENPSIAVWDHEQSEDLKPYLEKIADSFEAFLQKLH
jgi:hypothetical protein